MSKESLCHLIDQCTHYTAEDRHAVGSTVALQPVPIDEPSNDLHSVVQRQSAGMVKLKRSKVLRCNSEYARLFGCSPCELAGKTTTILYQAEAILDGCAESNNAYAQGEVVSLLLQIKHQDGTFGWYETSGQPVSADSDEMIWSLTNVTERKHLEEKTQQLAFLDPLTNMPNRRQLTYRLSLALETSKSNARFGAVMVLDLDKFKLINDTEGHEAGDRLLIEAGKRITSCVRKLDTVARIGGDEFVVIVNELDTNLELATTQAGAIANKIRQALEAPFLICGGNVKGKRGTTEHKSAASIGVVMFPTGSSDRDDYLNAADAAMYRAKEAGGNRVCF